MRYCRRAGDDGHFTMRILRARFRDRDAFLGALQTQFLHGGLFVATRRVVELGSEVVLDVRFPELRSRVLVRGVVAWRRPARRHESAPLPAGLGVELLASERASRDFLLAVARGEVIDLMQRRHSRLPVRLEIAWRSRGERERYTAQLEDIGEGGAFIRSTTFQPVGSTVLLEVMPPGGVTPLAIEARIAWTRHSEGEEGMGVEFRRRDTGGARRLRELVRRIREAGEESLESAARQA